MLQFITDSRSRISPVEQIKGVIAGGCRWVEIRMKDATDEEIAKVVDEIKPLCLETETFLLLGDRVELAKTLDVGGVNLSKGGILPSKARLALGPAAVIGVDVNNIEDIIAVRSLDIDYLSMVPFSGEHKDGDDRKYLGIEGIQDLCLQMDRLEINIGHVAAGGVQLEDVVPLMQAGANGVAVSAAIVNAADISKATREFMDVLKPFMKADGMKKYE